MRRRLLLLELVLLAAVIVTANEARNRWAEAQKRAAVVLGQRVPAAPAPPFTPLTPPARATAVAYQDVAQRTLFSMDRNPNVIHEVAPEKPMPALPVLFGVIDFGDGATAILSPAKGQRQNSYRAGETIGEFKLVSVNRRVIEFEWNKKRVVRNVDDLVDRTPPAQAAAAPEIQRGAPAPGVQAGPAVQAVTASGPGDDVGGNMRTCKMGDSSPAGTMQDGYKKVITESPFGKVCRWELVR